VDQQQEMKGLCRLLSVIDAALVEHKLCTLLVRLAGAQCSCCFMKPLQEAAFTASLTLNLWKSRPSTTGHLPCATREVHRVRLNYIRLDGSRR